jgi:hypothetical protein
MTSENFQQNFADATGLLVDRTFDPPKVLGEAFIVSKSRAVTCASCVFNYTEAPWALAIDFPHPDLLLGVKAIALHPEFDKKEARTNYLSFSGSPPERYPAQLNDFATLVLDPILQEVTPEKVGELRRALTLPFSSVGVDASGTVNSTNEILNVVKTIADSTKDGLLTFFDGMNIPIARIQFVGGSIKNVYYTGIVAEMAFAEFIFRSPASGFAFSSQSSFSWENIPAITVPTAALLQESVRRLQDATNGLNLIGGPQARYQKSAQSLALSGINENLHWAVQALWSAIDGFITVDNLARRIGADTYTVIQGIREMLNQGLISLLRKASPFHSGGQLGSPLTSHMDFDINPGDPLMAFYLDPLSGAPVWQSGEFSGVSSVLQPKNLLHTIPVNPQARGALVLKKYKLVGVHNGPIAARPGQTTPTAPVSQMVFMSAMLDMSARKLRGTTDSDDAATGLRLASLRTGSEAEVAEKVEKYVCPNCYSTNTKLGPCSNCGTIIEPPEEDLEPQGKLAKLLPIKKIRALQKRFGITKLQLIIGGSCAVGFPLFALAFCSAPSEVPTTEAAKPPTVHPCSADTLKVAANVAGFKGTTPPGYWYADTMETTKPLQSFGLRSDIANQNLLFVIFDDMSALNLESFISKPPYSSVTDVLTTGETRVDSGSQTLGYDALQWFCGRYAVAPTNANTTGRQLMLIASFKAKQMGKSVLVLGHSLTDEPTYDYKSALFLIDQMAEDFTQEENQKRVAGTGSVHDTSVTALEAKKPEGTKTDNKPIEFATDDQINEFIESMQDQLQDKYVLPDGMQKELKEPKSKKLHVNVAISIDNNGNITKMEITEPSEVEKVNDSLTKALKAVTPFKDAPKTKEGSLSVTIKLRKDKVKVALES